MSQTKEVEIEPTRTIDIHIFSKSGETHDGKISLIEWSEKERKSRALKKTLKIVGSIFGVSLIGLFVHLLLIIILPTLLITALASYPLYLKFSSEKNTIHSIKGRCPNCGSEEGLRPYVSSQFDKESIVQCPSCGQTAKIEAV